MKEETILLVEDEENDIFFMRRAVKQVGCEHLLQVVEDGQQAIDYIKGIGDFANRQRFPFPSLVLLDLKVPSVMGLEVLRWIRHESDSPALIVIILTSSKLRTDIDSAYRLGANSYLVKPPTPTKLLEVAEAVKNYWLKLNQAPSNEVEATVSMGR